MPGRLTAEAVMTGEQAKSKAMRLVSLNPFTAAPVAAPVTRLLRKFLGQFVEVQAVAHFGPNSSAGTGHEEPADRT